MMAMEIVGAYLLFMLLLFTIDTLLEPHEQREIQKRCKQNIAHPKDIA
jgi:hypothetical protein